MAAVLSWGLIFHYLHDFAVFTEQEQVQQFGNGFDNVYKDLGIDANNGKKQLGCVVDFLRLEFDII